MRERNAGVWALALLFGSIFAGFAILAVISRMTRSAPVHTRPSSGQDAAVDDVILLRGQPNRVTSNKDQDVAIWVKTLHYDDTNTKVIFGFDKHEKRWRLIGMTQDGKPFP